MCTEQEVALLPRPKMAIIVHEVENGFVVGVNDSDNETHHYLAVNVGDVQHHLEKLLGELSKTRLSEMSRAADRHVKEHIRRGAEAVENVRGPVVNTALDPRAYRPGQEAHAMSPSEQRDYMRAQRFKSAAQAQATQKAQAAPIDRSADEDPAAEIYSLMDRVFRKDGPFERLSAKLARGIANL